MEATYANSLPPEVLAEVTAQAHEDAENVARLIKTGKFHRPAEEDGAPTAILLGLGLASRLQRCEKAGLDSLPGIELPTSKSVLETVQRLGDGPDLKLFVATLFARLSSFFAEVYAWAGPVELQAQIAISAEFDEASLDAIAAFLYENRQSQ